MGCGKGRMEVELWEVADGPPSPPVKNRLPHFHAGAIPAPVLSSTRSTMFLPIKPKTKTPGLASGRFVKTNCGKSRNQRE